MHLNNHNGYEPSRKIGMRSKPRPVSSTTRRHVGWTRAR